MAHSFAESHLDGVVLCAIIAALAPASADSLVENPKWLGKNPAKWKVFMGKSWEVAGNLGESLNSMGICKFIRMSECG